MRNNGSILVLMSVAFVACSDKRVIETFAVSPDQKHLIVLTPKSARSIDVETSDEVARAENLDPIATFSTDGALLLTRTAGGTLLVMPTAGGSSVDLGQAIDVGTASPNHARIAFLRNKVACPFSPPGRGWLCGDLMVASAESGETVRVASGIRLLADQNGVIAATNAFDTYEFADNDTLVFTNFESSLLSVPADGSAPPRRIAGPVGISPGNVPLTPIWCTTPNAQVEFTSSEGLELVPARGGTPMLLVADPDAHGAAYFRSPNYQVRSIVCDLSPDGAYLVATDFRRPSYVKLVPVRGGTSLTLATQYNGWAAFNVNGELLFWDHSGTLSIASISGDVRSIGISINDLAAPIALSPDHRWIGVSKPFHVAACFNCISLQMVSSSTGESWTFADENGALPAWGYGFSPDSSSLLIIGAVRRTNNNATDSGGDLSVVPITGGVPKVLERNVDTAEWVDSQHIVFRHDQSPGIEVRRVP